MGNEENKQKQDLQNEVHRLQELLTNYQEIENNFREKLAHTESLLKEKIQTNSVIKSNLESKNETIAKLEEELNQLKAESQEKLNEKIEQVIALEVELKEHMKLLATAEERVKAYETKFRETQASIDNFETEKAAYLAQIAKLQEIITQTEEEIKEIEASHLEVQDQLHLEIKRTEERAGQIREDYKRETKGALARDRHIRVVLQQTELGRILLFLVDYFENTKKKSLSLDTLSTEVGIPPIICRTHLRHLHELAVCEFNELRREIKLIKRAK